MAALATGSTETRDAGVQDDSSFSIPGGDNAQNWKLKAEQAKKAEFIREADKLRHQIAILEKDKNGHLYNKKNDFRNEYSTLEECEQKLANSRKTDTVKTEQQLSKIHNNVRRLQLQLKDVEPTPEFVEKLREMMEEVDHAITTFKEEQRIIYEDLMKEEKTTIIELSALEKKIDASLSTVPEKSFKVPSGKAQLDTLACSQLPEEVVAFEKFLEQTGGRLGRWDDFDHQSFLKVWTRHKGKASYLEEALAYLPSRTREDVEQHETWYQEFLFLEEKKKESIQKWKAKKQEKIEMSKVQKKTKEITEFDQRQQEEAQRQKFEEDRRKRQQELDTWKRQKEIEAAAKLEAKFKEEEERQRNQRKERQRQLEVKLIVEENARIRKEQEEFLRLEKEMREEAEREERKRMAAYEICRFQERDQQKIEEKTHEKKAKEEVEKEKERRLAKLREKVQVHVDRDPSRLCKLTKGWEERCKNIGPTGSAPLVLIPHRAVPTWRQGL
ncbi:coiled-coil domain-containing protein 112 isoform X2 [Rhinoderma darwinii]|uniref:coiled-coil domain-containing protein 112 isoform X2 n=1 Tax=Rhinoderma darwinii TaxID=43563 RepID=UPI003F6627E0